ncbi:acyltransferase family protein [Streptomyces sp. NRRL B-3648]|uniref:acyltransferase family protein n=1 Tax=Streptomyces sp. NRRL B-3648 TaxID=1519493 RepID=UPI0006B0676D|nr:acyltransferase family protein [Streptomyces sp. NRRL B-3648]KOV94679.1 membrane protein [Streptomyces sp. NRRL B-3648]
MFDAASSPGQNRRPLPPAQQPVDGVPGPRTPLSAPEPRSKADSPGRQRDSFFDNAKYLAIVLVAMGHSWEPLKGDSRILEGVYTVVYAFHMPAFIIVSGFFSRSFDMRPDRLKRLITGVVVPYVLFETAYPLFKNAVTGSHEEISLLDPWYLTWFLVALFVWRLTTPVWKLVRWPLPVALGIAMLATVSPNIGDDLDLQRVLQFLPYFVLGLCMKPEHFHLVRRRWVRVVSVPVFAAALAVGWWAVPRMNTGWFYHRDSAQELGAPWWCGPVMTLAMMGCSLVLTACFFAWVPRRRMWFTALGAGTLYGYLLHGFLVKFGDYRGWFEHPWLHRPLGEITVTLLAGAAVTLLCTGPVRRVFRFAMEPRMEWAFRQDAAELARERQKPRETAGV